MQDPLAGVLPPTRLGRYQIVQRLGAGGMAEVFLAVRHGAAGFARAVAVKRILPQFGDNPEFIRLLQREAAIAAMTHHPNCVQVNELEEADGEHFMSMELLFGVSVADLRKLLRDAGRSMPIPIVVRIAADAAHAIQHVHSLDDGTGRPLGIVHRDISPQNLFVTERGLTKVLDFGIAKAVDVLDSETRTGMMMGKYAFMSPEQVALKPVDGRCDVWALGVTLWELLTESQLFSRDSIHEVIQQIQTRRIPPPSELRPDVPHELDSIVMGALTRDLDKRTATAGEMAAALDELLSHMQGSDYAEVAALMMEMASAEVQSLKRLAAMATHGQSSSSSAETPVGRDTGAHTKPVTPRARLSTGEALADTVMAAPAVHEGTPSASNVRPTAPGSTSRSVSRTSRSDSRSHPTGTTLLLPRRRHLMDALAVVLGIILGVLVYWLVLG